MDTISDDLLSAEVVAAELTAQKSSRGRQKIYKELSDEHRAEIISADVRCKAQELKQHRSRVNLLDIEQVRERTQIYLDACAQSGTIPNILGLASLGYCCSRQWVNEFVRTHPDSESAEYIERLKDMFADTLINASLSRTADSTMGIFVLKNCAGFRDRFEVEPILHNDSPLGSPVDSRELLERYAELPED